MRTVKLKNYPKNTIEEKLVINSITDLLKIPITKINNSKIENFSGLYFDKIYEEAIKSETPTQSNQSKAIEKKIKIKENESNPKIKTTNKNIPLAINHVKDIELNNSQCDDRIPVNKNIDDYKYIKNNEKLNKNDLDQKEDETQDNEFETEKNDFYTPYTKPHQKSQDNQKIKNSKIPINKLLFSINYNSNYGEEVAILGSLSKLGFWQLSGGLPLHWNEGNIWTGEIDIEDDDWQIFEFKIVVVEKGIIKKWEKGENNVIDFDGLIKNIESNKIGRYNKYKYEYNKNEASLLIKCYWN